MIRILHYGLSNHLGGIETYLRKLYISINKEKFVFDFLIIGNEKPYWYEEFKELGSKFYFVTARDVNPFKNKLEIDRIFKNEDYDIMHCHLNSLSYITPVLSAVKHNIKTIVHSRNAGVLTSIKSKVFHKLNYYRLPKNRITMLAVSDYAGEWMFGTESNFKVINNGLDINKYKFDSNARKKIRAELVVTEDEYLIIHIGAFRIQKNHFFLLDIFKELLKKKMNAKLILVGDGDLREKIQEKIIDLDITENVYLLGERDDVASLYSSADCLVFPSFYEGFPNAVLEAQTTGIPTIISDTITSEVVINSNCLKQSLSSTAEEWSNKIIEMDYSLQREEAYRNILNAGLSHKQEIKKIENIYQELFEINKKIN